LNKDTIKKEFTELIEENQGIIFKVSAMYCNDLTCRKDLVQEILLQLWRSFPSYNKTKKYTTWMYRIALNTAISQWRKDKSKKEVATDKLPITLTDDDIINEKSERARMLNIAINKLNKAEKSIIILYMDDYPYDEISEIIGISVSNVGVKINRIKKKLQYHLKELGYGL
jgi:RNA polymerase sigma-70 factor (ECF subfamily)